MRRCRFSLCKKELPPVKQCESAYQKKGFCNVGCMADHGLLKARQNQKRQAGKERRERRVTDKKRLAELKPRSHWYNSLQKLVNQWIVHVRDKGKPCCTCGTANPNIKYDAGHCFPVGRGGADRRRFEPLNIARQCSVNCNGHGSGMRHEYERFIIETYGQDKFDWLRNENNFPLLKDQFPELEDIKKEMARYRVLLRDNGIKPAT